ncbi:MAG TPA: c-type cytochrome [Burkholderiaceae bacterium]|nr:c-type cytochrome [Burkholderiaceae bacterium]
MNSPEQHVEQTEHEGLIKTPKQLITTIVLAFIIPITVILLLIRLVTASSPLGIGSDAQSQEAVARRIQPVAGFSLVSAAGAAEEKTGEQVYAATCSACHTGGVAGAPKLGDAAAWAPLIAKGYDALLKNAINGVNAMPPRGGNPALSDLEVGRAVVHIANQSGASFPEPEGSGDAAPAEAAAPAEQAPAQAAAAEAAPAEAPAAEQAAAPAAETQQPAAEAAAPAAGGDIDLAAGEQLYKSVCFACHSAGVAGAPKVGDKAAWEPLIAAGMDQMIKIAIEGKGAMPPRGGSSASDEQIAASVHYMVNASK